MKWPLDLLKHTSEGTPYEDKEEEIGDETFDVNKWASALLSMKPWEEEGIANGTFGVVKLASALLAMKRRKWLTEFPVSNRQAHPSPDACWLNGGG